MAAVAPSRFASQPAVAVTSSSTIGIQTSKLGRRWIKKGVNGAVRQRSCLTLAAQAGREDLALASATALEARRSTSCVRKRANRCIVHTLCK